MAGAESAARSCDHFYWHSRTKVALLLLQLISNAHVSIGMIASCCGRPETEPKLGSAQRHMTKKVTEWAVLDARDSNSVCKVAGA